MIKWREQLQSKNTRLELEYFQCALGEFGTRKKKEMISNQKERKKEYY